MASEMLPVLGHLVWGKWHPPAQPTGSFAGQTVLITGANVGLGFEAAIKFAQMGASKLVLGVRSLEKGEAASKTIRQRSGRVDLEIVVYQLDMLEYGSVKAFANRVTQELERLDVAVLNAGMQAGKTSKLSKYGWEETLQVNTLSTALLGLLLLPKLKAAKSNEAGGRDILPHLEIVGSGVHYGFQVTDEQKKGHLLDHWNTPEASGQTQYTKSKFALMGALHGLAKLAISPLTGQPDVVVDVVCPGACRSEIARNHARALKWIWETLFCRTTEEGARTLVSGTLLGTEAHNRFWQHDELKKPPPSIEGKEGELLKEKLWKEIYETLKRENPEVANMAGL